MPCLVILEQFVSNNGNERASKLMDALTDSFRYTKMNGVILACFLICTTL